MFRLILLLVERSNECDIKIVKFVNMAKVHCVNNPNLFCYVCGQYTLTKNLRNINDLVKETYSQVYKIQLLHYTKPWAPNKVCMTCYTCLNRVYNGKYDLSYHYDNVNIQTIRQ